MIERFTILGKPGKRKKTIYLTLLIGMLFIVISYLFVPLSSFDPNMKEIENSGCSAVSPENKNNYLYQENGKYFLATDNNLEILIPPEHVQHMLESGIKLKNRKDDN